MAYGGLGIARYEAHTGWTVTASAAVAIKQAVTISGDKTIAPANPGDVVIGIVTKAAGASEKAVVRLKGDVFPINAAAAITAGQLVVANAGSVQPRNAGTPEAAETLVGVALEDGTTGSDVLVMVI